MLPISSHRRRLNSNSPLAATPRGWIYSSEINRTPSNVSFAKSTGRNAASTRDQVSLRDQSGLSVLYEPGDTPSVDIVFVHGLGGKSHRTWAKNGEPHLFWPQAWLPTEEGLRGARILTFGYNADLLPEGRFTISDFANDLLLAFSNDAHLRIGRTPVIFVAHSMGGLVVKKACILGIGTGSYEGIPESNTAIMFLSTPHYGSALAKWLDRTLQLSPFGYFANSYVSELRTNSFTLQNIHSQFLTLRPLPTVASFSEKLRTSIVGPVKMMILQKELSIFGYTGETVKFLNADHHSICKYASLQDQNYIEVRNVLRGFADQLRVKNALLQDFFDSRELYKVQRLLHISELPEKDLAEFHRYYVPRSCQTFISGQTFQHWLGHRGDYPQVLWLNGPHAVGKSVLSSCVITLLRERETNCHFYYFRFEDEETWGPGDFLRSIAYQVAKDVPHFRKELISLSETLAFQEAEEGSDIWRTLLIEKLSQVISSKRIYWVADGIEMCRSPDVLLDTIAYLVQSNLPLRVMLLSRRTTLLCTSFRNLARSTRLTELNMDTNREDVSLYIRETVKKTLSGLDFAAVEDVVESVLGYAGGNFLWARLGLERILQYESSSEVRAASTELRFKSGSPYRRMEEALLSKLTDSDVSLARMVYSWVVCARRQLTTYELSEALDQGFNSVQDLSSTMDKVCGGFVRINDHTSKVAIVDQSAQDYLTQVSIGLRINLSSAHAIVLHKCLSVLSKLSSNYPHRDTALELRFEKEPLMDYASSAWIYHLSESGTTSAERTLHLLVKVFDSPCVLVWISIVASSARLQTLVQAAEALSSFLLHQSQQLNTKHHQVSRRTVQRWATDLLQITAKFGDHLIRYPRAIYSLVPAFCPRESLMGRFERNGPVPSISVTGLSPYWDDCLARFPVRKDWAASKILCADRYFAVSTTSGKGLSAEGFVTIFRTQTCEEVAMLEHGEPVLDMKFSATCHFLATYSHRYIKIWATPTNPGAPAELLHTLTNSGPPQLLALAFSVDDESLITFSRDGVIRQILFRCFTSGGNDIGLALGDAGSSQYKAPHCAAFNGDASAIAVGFRGAPLTVRELVPFRPIHHHQRRNLPWIGVTQLEWNPRNGWILGLYDDGCVFKWHPSKTVEAEELYASAINIRYSIAGKLFATSSHTRSGGSKLTVWDFEQFLSVHELSLPDGVTDLAINPNGQRIYDLRDLYCTIWQPISLMRRGEYLQRGYSKSDTTPCLSEQDPPVEGSIAIPKNSTALTIPKDISALAISQNAAAYCTGNMNGDLQIITDEGHQPPFTPFFKAPIRHLLWSSNGNYLAIANSARCVSVNAVANRRVIFSDILDAPVRQLLFNKSSNRLFAATLRSLYIWEIGEQPRLLRQSVPLGQSRWINHPRDDQQLLGFAFDTLSVLPWQDLEREFELRIEPTTSSTLETLASQSGFGASAGISLECVASVDKVLTSCDGSVILLQISKLFPTDGICNEFFIWPTAQINNLDYGAGKYIELIPLPQHLQASIRIPFAFVDAGASAIAALSPLYTSLGTNRNESHLAFLSNEGWICTMYLGGKDVPARVKNHYFLPKDWLIKDSLELTNVTATGTLYHPKNGAVCVVRNALRIEWTE